MQQSTHHQILEENNIRIYLPEERECRVLLQGKTYEGVLISP
jgi:hypothetical protein